MECKVVIRQLETELTLVEVSGEMDAYTAPAFKETLVRLIIRGYHWVVINFEELDFIDSSGLRVLLDLHADVTKKKGSLSLVVTKHHLKKIFKITGLMSPLQVFDQVEEALENLRAQQVKQDDLELAI